MFIVSEPELDAATDAYLDHLREQFRLPLYYRQVNLQRLAPLPSGEGLG
jgi:hypothetical protein